MPETLPWCPGVVFVAPGEPGYDEALAEDNRRCERMWFGHGMAVAEHMDEQFAQDDESVGDWFHEDQDDWQEEDEAEEDDVDPATES